MSTVPLCVTECCREWICGAGGGWGRCGICGERPAYVRMLPEPEWLEVPGPRQEWVD